MTRDNYGLLGKQGMTRMTRDDWERLGISGMTRDD